MHVTVCAAVGTSLSKASPCAVDRAWLYGMNDSIREQAYDPMNMVIRGSASQAGGMGCIIQGLISGSATRNERMRPGWNTGPGAGTGSRGMDIRLGHSVLGVRHGSGGAGCVLSVRVRDPGDGTVTLVEMGCDKVLLTVPLGVLKTHALSFLPPLSPQKQQAIAAAGMGRGVVKVTMEFDRVFWPSSSEFIDYIPGQGQRQGQGTPTASGESPPCIPGLLTSFWNVFLLTGRKILVGYVLGDAAVEAFDQVTRVLSGVQACMGVCMYSSRMTR